VVSTADSDDRGPLLAHFCEDDSVHAGTRWDCQPCETARRTALYGTCEDCGGARDVRPAPRGSHLTCEFYCPGCGRTA
jgi:hypothetical protein